MPDKAGKGSAAVAAAPPPGQLLAVVWFYITKKAYSAGLSHTSKKPSRNDFILHSP